jgi:hypothetical protein
MTLRMRADFQHAALGFVAKWFGHIRKSVGIWSWLGRRHAWEQIRVSSRSTMSRSFDSYEQIEIEVGYTKW